MHSYEAGTRRLLTVKDTLPIASPRVLPSLTRRDTDGSLEAVQRRRPYDESVFARAEEDYEERRLKRLKRDAAALGMQLVPNAGLVS